MSSMDNQIERRWGAELPGMSWADLAETDYEMQLMGPPPLPPGICSDEQFETWVAPRRTTRPRELTDTRSFVTTQNRFTMLQGPAAEEPPLLSEWAELPLEPVTSSCNAASQRVELPPPPPSPRTHSERPASAS